jgi:uncharacterized protein (DUF1697 family)
MASYVALLRGVNVSGHNLLSMKDLQALVRDLPAEDVATYLQSGNVVFHSEVTAPEALQSALEEGLAASTAPGVKVLVRTADELAKVIEANPFPTGDEQAASQLHVTFLAEVPVAARVASLKAPETRDRYHLGDRAIYLSCPDGYGRTKLNNAFFERQLDVAATTRNWRTVTTLARMARG